MHIFIFKLAVKYHISFVFQTVEDQHT